MHNNPEDMVADFFCNMIPNATNACSHRVEKGMEGSFHVGKSLNYDILAVRAYEDGLLNHVNMTREEVSNAIRDRQENDLNSSAIEFPLICLSSKEEEDLLGASLSYELKLQPDWYASSRGETEHRAKFSDAVQEHKFCSVNSTAVMLDSGGATFFFRFELLSLVPGASYGAGRVGCLCFVSHFKKLCCERNNRTTTKMMISRAAVPICFIVFLPCLVAIASNDDRSRRLYVDVEKANTTFHLEAIRRLPISSYKLEYERSKNRTRVGAVGPNVALVPEVVEIVPKRVMPPIEKGGKPVELFDVPIVNEQKLFMYGIGATQELSTIVGDIEHKLIEQTEMISHAIGELSRLEQLLVASSEFTLEEKIKSANIESEISKAAIRMDVQRAEQEEKYGHALKSSEIVQLKKSEQLTLARLEREDISARKRADVLMNKKLETSRKVERARAEAAESVSAKEHERALKIQEVNEQMKAETAKAVAIAKAEAERANEDIHLRRLKAEAETKRQRNIATISTIYDNLAQSLSSAAKNPKQVLIFIGHLALLSTALFTAREAARLCRAIIEAAIGRPKLVRETSRKSMFLTYACLIQDKIFSIIGSKRSKKSISDRCEKEFEDLILSDDLKERVVTFAKAASKARQHNAPNRHLLLYGPPGTGKTMVARKLAKCVGMDYALMSGGDVGPLGSDAVTQIHSLFMWAKISAKGVLLFIDEAEAFLLSRSKSTMSESTHNALNALLYNTSGDSNVLLVLATNRAQDLDAAVLDRCDESLYFPLPSEPCRKSLLCLYFNKLVCEKVESHNTSARSKWSEIKSRITRTKPFLLKIQSNAMGEDQLLEAASITAGFSGREIGKLMLAIQSTLYSSPDGELTVRDIQTIVETKVNEHRDKQFMMKPQDAMASSMSPKQEEHNGGKEKIEFEFGKRKHDLKRYSYHRYGSFSMR
eukprot:CAMPEP_0116024260 /NCGR_PEP_ID=MMETSP0321-20121206/12198_1 /TAXON_ID=163516 /ORGANISM="Leptocylindrus danicus var. danicus, Strain B650" /LENGTH=937 /DNA_ID=CAMNT_0003495931 /DNA_START=987 /DNA_END=3801 /DNA_ORIENTATION=-